jgi:hypothetical protein
VEFVVKGTTYTKIRLRMYDYADVPQPCTSEYGYVCDKYSFYGGANTITVNASAPIMSIDEILGLGIAHELQHLCFAINVVDGYKSINETMSTLAEYFVDSWRPHFYDLSYDAGVARPQSCEPWIRYDTEKAWIVYLYEAFRGGAQDPADDLVYRWINSDAPVGVDRLSLEALAVLVWQQNDYAWLGGADSRERFARLGANYLAAKFCNAPALGSHGEFGSGGMNTVRDLALFLNNCAYYDSAATPMSPVDCPSNAEPGPNAPPLYPAGHFGCWNVRVLVPDYELTDGNNHVWVTVDSIYTDGDDGRTTPEPDGSKDYIDVQNTGTDYVIFRAGSYYDDGRQHNLHLRLRGTMGAQIVPQYAWQYPITPVGWVIGYGTHEGTLQLHPEAIQFIEVGTGRIVLKWCRYADRPREFPGPVSLVAFRYFCERWISWIASLVRPVSA